MILGTLTCFLFFTAWAAVGWHRFVLLDERGSVTPFHFRLNAKYIVYAIVAILISAPLMFFVLGLLSNAFLSVGGLYPLQLPILVIAICFVEALAYRVCILLPALSVGKPIGFLEAFRQTDGAMPSLILIAFINMAVVKSWSFLSDSLTHSHETLSIIMGMLSILIGFVFSISLLTMLYGHFVEERPLA